MSVMEIMLVTLKPYVIIWMALTLVPVTSAMKVLASTAVVSL